MSRDTTPDDSSSEDLMNESFEIVSMGYQPHLVETEIRDMIHELHQLWLNSSRKESEPIDYKYDFVNKTDEEIYIELVKLLTENCTYSPQVNGFVIHGAIKGMVNYFKNINKSEIDYWKNCFKSAQSKIDENKTK